MKKQQRLAVRAVILLLLIAAVGYTIFQNFNKEEAKKIEKDKAVPDFVLTDVNGEKVKLSDFRGKGVVLNFWATYCGPCEKEMPAIDNQYAKHKDEGVTVLAVNMGESDLAVKRYIERLNIQIPIAIDADGDVQTAYKVSGLPATFFIDSEGNLANRHVGQLTEEMLEEYIKEIKP